MVRSWSQGQPLGAQSCWPPSHHIDALLQLRPSASSTFPSLFQDGRNKYDADEDDDDDSLDQEPPYRSLTSPGGMRRFGTLASLEMLDDADQVAEDSTDSDDHGAWDSDIEEEDYKKKQEVAGRVC